MEEIVSSNQWFFKDIENFSAAAAPSLAMPAVNPSTSCNEQQFCRHEVANDQPKKSAKSTSLEPRLRRIRANNRERRRIQAINDAMEALRKAIPSTNNKRKLTKLELLRLAQEYIRQLSEMLCSSTSPFEDEVVNVSFSYPVYSNYFPETCFTN
ncbi:Neurogenic differentiation factor 1 [Stylophora pistillata]|uniref:Neurogenic differentiation factor 1 n=1 Tax=Stylophora pistillata TaxID=50429 RepID=A0A2B4S5M8_STYPI|nr:Neurogenic differentiation factor 1 [Stylophora pistillata]